MTAYISARIAAMWQVRKHSTVGTVWLSAFATTGVLLSFPAFVRCQEGSALWAGLADTIGLFVLSFSDQWSSGPCMAPIPLGIELARVFASVTTIAAFVIVASRVFRSAIDSWEIRRAPDVVVFIGVDDETLPYLSRIAIFNGKNQNLTSVVLLTSAPDRACVQKLATVGVKVVRTDIDSDEELSREVSKWRVSQVYFVSSDSTANIARLSTFLALTDNGRETASTGDVATEESGPKLGRALLRSRYPRRSLPRFVVRIDDVSEAERWRRNYLGETGVALDVVGLYTATAETIMRPFCDPAGTASNQLLPEGSDEEVDFRPSGQRDSHSSLLPIRSAVICGGSPLTWALLDWLAQSVREARFLAASGMRSLPAPQIDVTLIAPDADEFVWDHERRQRMFGSDVLGCNAVCSNPTVADIRKALESSDKDPGQSDLVVITDGCTDRPEILGARVADEFPEVYVLEYSDRLNVPVSFVKGRMVQRFGLFLGIPDGLAPQAIERWYRMGQLLHAAYLRSEEAKIRRAMDDPSLRRPAQAPWEQLPALYKRDNIRAALTTFDSVRKLGWSWSAVPNGRDLGRPFFPSWDDSRIAEDRKSFESTFGFSSEELRELAKAEAASWCNLRTTSSPAWKAPAPRAPLPSMEEMDDAARKDANQRRIAEFEKRYEHPALLPWEDLSEENRVKTEFTVMQTLAQLRQLGYYATREDDECRGQI
ncbi:MULTISPECIES: hypothetical protein [Dietzia]|uniref:hypothetical protein n=1 Tax=Dietzia sp. KRD202 TaxID=2729732 RepID=UPI0019D1B62F|nr:hypothetical protein [Dietzia sp. KRD202]